MSTSVARWTSSLLGFAATALVGCFAPDDPEDTPHADAASASESSGDTAGTSSGGTSPATTTTSASTDVETTIADTGESTDAHAESSSSSDDGTDTTTTTGITASCGDGMLDEVEECDDGNDEDADACSNACVAGFYTGTLDPCSADGQTMCGYFEAQCRRDPGGGELAQLCYWPQGSSPDACATTPGIWTPSDSAFALDSGFDFPMDGACISQLGNLACSAADTQTCAQAGGALCFHEVGPVGEPLDEAPLCWWNVDEPGCEDVPGVWTTADSGFGAAHPKALPPSGAAACLLQVPFI